MAWTEGLEAWMVGLQYLVVLIIGIGIGIGISSGPGNETVLTRTSLVAAILVGLADIAVLFAPDLYTGLTRGDPWWGFVEAGVFAVVLGGLWIGLTFTATYLGAYVGRAVGRRRHQPPHGA